MFMLHLMLHYACPIAYKTQFKAKIHKRFFYIKTTKQFLIFKEYIWLMIDVGTIILLDFDTYSMPLGVNLSIQFI